MAAARERRKSYVRGHQLAEMRATAGVTQAELADALGVSQARISKIEHGEISGIAPARNTHVSIPAPGADAPIPRPRRKRVTRLEDGGRSRRFG